MSYFFSPYHAEENEHVNEHVVQGLIPGLPCVFSLAKGSYDTLTACILTNTMYYQCCINHHRLKPLTLILSRHNGDSSCKAQQNETYMNTDGIKPLRLNAARKMRVRELWDTNVKTGRAVEHQFGVSKSTSWLTASKYTTPIFACTLAWDTSMTSRMTSWCKP